MTVWLAFTALFTGLVVIGVFSLWMYYAATHGYGIGVRPSIGARIAHVAIVVGTMLSAIFYLRHYWLSHEVIDPSERSYSIITMFGPVLIWFVAFMFWLERVGKRR